MKLSAHAVRRFWDLHAWAGVVGGLVLYIMFLTGAIALFQHQLETWGEPLAQQPRSPLGLQATLDRAVSAIGSTPDDLWFYPATQDHGAAKLIYGSAGASITLWVDPQQGPQQARVVPERERLSSFLYALHFLYHDATGNALYYLAGVLSVAMVLALVTGVLIHLKKIVREFHQFRPDRSRRVMWSDMHKVLGVMGLPFQLMYAYTGAFIILAPLLLQSFVGPVFGGDDSRAATVAWGTPAPGDAGPPGAPAALTLDELAARARAARPDLAADLYHLINHGRPDGAFEAWGEDRGTPTARVVVKLREADGVVLQVQSAAAGAADDIARRWINGLHFAHFGGLSLRFLFFLLALATCATILTGNWVWIARRAARQPGAGTRILARLTAGVGAGTLVAMAALLLASRLLPLDWRARGSTEEVIFVAALGLCIAWALAATDHRALWWRQLGLAGILLAPVPLLAARWSSAGLFGAGPRIATVAGVDLAILIAAAACCATAVAMRRGGRTERVAPPSAATGPIVDDVAQPLIALSRAGGRDA